MSSPSATRSTWIDAAKGLGIVLIFLGHVWSTETPSAIYVWIYAFHVPLFFFVSGLTLKPGAGALPSVIGKKLRTLIVPYFCYAFLGYAFYVAGYFLAQKQGIRVEQFDYGLWPPLAGLFYGTIGEGRLINGPVWFLMALFWTFLIGYLINTLIRQPILQWLVVLAVTALGLVLAERVTLPFSGVAALIALVFLQAGYSLRSQINQLATWAAGTRWTIVAALFIVSLFSQINGFVRFGEGIVGNPAWLMLFAFAGLLMVILVLQLLEDRVGWLAFVGRYSLEIMLIHMLVIKSVKVLMSGMLKLSITQIDNDLGLGLIVMLVSVLLVVPAVWVMVRYLPLTVGKATAPLSRRPVTS